jgi:hypothetical protein
MARLLYASCFDVVGADVILSVLSTYRNWIAEHYHDKSDPPDIDFHFETGETMHEMPRNHALSSSVYENADARVIRIRWSFPDQDDSGLRWINEVRVGQFGDLCSVEHLILIESIGYNVSPAKLIFGSPRAVRDICTDTPAFIDEIKIRAKPRFLVRDNLDDLLKLLNSKSRRLPVVLMSPHDCGEPNRIDAAKLARNLAGVAVVIRIDDPVMIWELRDEIGRRLSCSNGAARIYWPGFSKESDPRTHRLFLGPWIDHVGSHIPIQTIVRTIFAVAAFRYVPDSRIVEVIRKVETADRQKLLLEKKDAREDFWADYERDLELLEKAEKLIEELAAENANLKANQKLFFASGIGTPDEISEVGEIDESSFSSVSGAVELAIERCNDLEFLDSAISSASDSSFQRPYDVFRALSDLNDIVDTWKANRENNRSGGDILQHLRDRGWGKRSSMHISDTTRGKFRAHYEFEYQGKKHLFEPHITIGAGDSNSCASIHFFFDQDRVKMIIGHVGKHLPNTMT